MSLSSLLILSLASPFVAALLSPLAYARLHRRAAVSVPLAGALVPLLSLLAIGMQAAPPRLPATPTWSWIPSLRLDFAFLVDGFGLLFALLVAGMGLLIVVYAHFYMEHEAHVGRFFAYLLLFLGSMLGVCLGGHLFTFYLFWELTSISSFLLIGFWHEKDKSRAGALKALLITSGGGLFMMGGLALLGAKTGQWTWTGLASVAGSFAGTTWGTCALVLVLLGAFTKSAQFPFHIWLPDAMEAPTPVSAFLHSATMVKAGIILIFRLHPIFSDHALWFPLLSTVGMTTAVVGAVLALKHTDLKAILAYSTISQLGLFVAMQGYASIDDMIRAGFIFHIFVHAFYKGGLFMLAGIIDHAAHTREITRLGRLWRTLPFTGLFVLLAAGSLAGLPPFLGFISKEAALEASLHMAHHFGGAAWLLPVALAVAAAISIAVALKISIGILFAPPADPSALAHQQPRELGWGILLPPALIATAGLVFGLFPGALAHLLYPLALQGLNLPEPHFKLWHGLNPALGLSAAAIAGGTLLYRFRRPVQAVHARLKLGWNLNTVHDRGWESILAVAERFTARFQNGSLSQYVLITVGFFALLVGGTALVKPDWSLVPWTADRLFSQETFNAAGIASFAILVVVLRDRIARLVALGGVGVLVVVYFILRGAPDLALTGFLIEVAMFILILLVFKQLKDEEMPPADGHHAAKLLAACAAGGLIGLLSYIGVAAPSAPSIFPYFMENAEKLAGGLNVVNVIVVDFRGFDTMGEISVLVFAALGVFGLRRVWAAPREVPEAPQELMRRALPRSVILDRVSAFAFPLIILFALYVLFRGHNAPGGGFIGGLITAGGLILELLGAGRERFLKRLPATGRGFYGIGLALAFATGLAPLFFGYPFLTSFVVNSIHFSTASVFDLGVYFVVVGVTLDIMLLIEKPEPRPTA